MAKSIIPQINPKTKREILKQKTNVNQVSNPTNDRSVVDLMVRVNEKLENRSGFYLYNIRPEKGVLRGKFYLEKSTFQSILFVSEPAQATTIGNWIWLIIDDGDYKLIVSKAQATVSENKIPEANAAFQILSNSGETLSENRVQSSDFDWKNNKVNEGLFDGIKGFFVGKGALNNFCLNIPQTDGLQIELWQLPNGSPILYFSRVWGFKRKIDTFGSTTTARVLVDDGEGMAGSRPCPPYSN